MRFIVCILALAVAANATPVGHDFGVAVKDFYYKVREQLPCGIKGSGPLAPFIVEEGVGKDPLKYHTDGWEFQFDLTKVKLDGLNTFEILKSVYDKNTNEYKIEFILPKVYLEANYRMSNKIDTDYLTASTVNNGTVNFHISDSSHYGFSFFFGHNKTTGDLIVEKFKFIYPEDVKAFEFDVSEDKKEYVEEFKKLMKEIEKEFDDVYNDYMSVKFNKVFEGYKTVEDLAAYFYKIAGDKEHGPLGEPKCNHV